MTHAHALPRFPDPAGFDVWEADQAGAWELHDGIPVAVAPERADHARLKAQCWLALRHALRAKKLPCEALVDGLTVRGPGARRFKPDVVVTCGARLPGDAQVVEHPVILVEVLSPSTEHVDTGLKLDSYFALPSVQHYLVLSTQAQIIISYARLDTGRLLTGLHATGAVDLQHPGISVAVGEIYEGTSIADGA